MNTKTAEKEKTKGKANSRVGSVTEVTRHIKNSVRCLLWGKSAGRCQFRGCNQELWKSPVTQEPVNIAEAAHIYSFSDSGPRGNDGIDSELLNEIDNLMLACDACHKTMDQDKNGKRYSVEVLQQWKFEHERRVELVTGIDSGNSSHILFYGTNIGEHGQPLNYLEAAQAMFPARFPANEFGFQLSTVYKSISDKDSVFWEAESTQLIRSFERSIKPQINSGEIQHLSVFGLAPQPLLILLGSLLTDIIAVDVYQRHREPTPTWKWPELDEELEFKVERPTEFGGRPVLILELSAPVNEDRIIDVIPDANIWRLYIPNPNNDHMKGKGLLSRFRKLSRQLIDEIKGKHGQTTELHVFPVGSVSASIEFGRVRQPKAHMPWIVYDQNNKSGGFHPAVQID